MKLSRQMLLHLETFCKILTQAILVQWNEHNYDWNFQHFDHVVQLCCCLASLAEGQAARLSSFANMSIRHMYRQTERQTDRQTLDLG